MTLAGIGLACTLQQLGCEHLKSVGKPPHRFPKPEVICAAIKDNMYSNAVSRLLLRYWKKGGRDLATSVGGIKTREVSLGRGIFFGK